MKTYSSSLMIAAAIMLLASGCGKTDTSTPAKAPDTSAKAANPEPAPNPTVTTVPTPATPPATPAPSVSAVPTDNGTLSSVAVATNPPASAVSTAASVPAVSSLASLSQDQMVQGLKDALGTGLQRAVANLGHDGGFLTNAAVKIPMPEKLQKVESALRAMKQDKLADDFVTTMNRAAEQAVPVAGSVFVDALKQMRIEDARSILSGPDNAATQYFEKATRTNLYAQFYPIVQKATQKNGVTSAYKAVVEKANMANSLGQFGSALSGAVLDKDSMDVDAYVTGKSLDGLFKMVADQEKQIRQNPAARATDLMKTVFGALKN